MRLSIKIVAGSIFTICFLQFLNLWAQTESNPMRIELEARPNAEPYNLVPYGKEGMILFTQTNEFEDRHNRTWLITFLDTNLKERWTKTLAIPRNMAFRAHSSSSQQVVSLFYDDKSAPGIKYFCVIATGDSASIRTIEGSLTSRLELVAFDQSTKWVYLGMSSKNAALVLCLNKLSGEILEIKLKSEGGTYIEDINADDENNELVILTSFRNIRTKSQLFLHRFDDAGQLTGFEQVMKTDGRPNFSSVEYVSLGEKGWMIAGSYSTGSLRKLGTDIAVGDVKSSGFYQLISNPSSQAEVFYHNFSDFGNLENYFRGPEVENMQRRLKRKQQSGKPAQLELNLVVQKIRKYKDLYLLCAEAFVPNFKTVTTITYDYYGRPIPRTYSVFDGYTYSHALVAALNEKGQLVWSGGIEMLNVRSFNLDYKISLFIDGDDVILAYTNEGKIAWKTIAPNAEKENIAYTSIESSHPKDRVTAEQKSQLSQWYDNFFLAYGYQSIVNNYHPTQQRRNIFFINKLVFD